MKLFPKLLRFLKVENLCGACLKSFDYPADRIAVTMRMYGVFLCDECLCDRHLKYHDRSKVTC